jgi:putative sigma-54 modulation protein
MDSLSDATRLWARRMKMTAVEIRTQQMAPTTAMRNFVNRRARTALGRYGRDVSSATLRLDDVNGPRGGNDKRCLLAIAGSRLGLLVVEATHSNFYTAVSRVMRRASEALRRTIGRKRVTTRIGSRRQPRRRADLRAELQS